MEKIGVRDFEILPGSKIRVKTDTQLITATTSVTIRAQALDRITFEPEEVEVFKLPKNTEEKKDGNTE